MILRSPEKAAARASGAIRYFTGKPCRNGHIAERLVCDGHCIECKNINGKKSAQRHPQTSALAKRRYRERNREKLRAAYADYCERKGDEVREQKRRYAARNILKERARSKAKFYRDKEKCIERNKRWKENNRDKVNAIARRFRERHPLKGRMTAQNRRALRRGLKGKQTSQGIAELFRLQKNKCGYCRADLTKVSFHIDHITPVSKGGSNERKNLQILCQPCNSRKHASDPIDFAQSLGMLL
jgi:5-methylcytosine-specific restriction endonuclease McrA